MKKCVYCLLFVLCLSVFVPIFCACEFKSIYNLTNFEADFYALVTNHSVVAKNGEKLKIVYSNNLMSSLVVGNSHYQNLQGYQILLDNGLDFVYRNMNLIKSSEGRVQKKYKKQLKSALDDFDEELDDFQTNLNSLVDLVNVNVGGNETSESCLNSLAIVAVSYRKIIQAGIAVSEVCEDIYYNDILTDKNPNVSDLNTSNFEVELVTSVLPNRISSQIVALTRNFVKTRVEASALHEGLKDGTRNIDLSLDSYSSNINLINRNIIQDSAIVKANQNKSNFLSVSIVAQNQQSVLFNDRAKTLEAYHNFGGIISDNSTLLEKTYKTIIDNDLNVLKSYNGSLVALLNIILGA